MDVKDILTQARRAVEDANVPDDLREIAFSKAIDILSQGAAVPHRATATSTEPARSIDATASTDTTSHTDSATATIARRIGVPLAVVSEVYYEEDGELGLSIPSSRLSRDKASGTREIALIVAVGRQAGGFDPGWTPTAVIREFCIYYSKFDQRNFAFTIARMDDEFQLKGKGQRREVRVKQRGYEKAAELLLALASKTEKT